MKRNEKKNRLKNRAVREKSRQVVYAEEERKSEILYEG